MRIRTRLIALALPFCASLLAQFCTGNLQVGCTSPGATCSPVNQGVGKTGRCVTRPGLPPGERECECVGAPVLNLNGTWVANDGSLFYLRQIGLQLWWAGLSVESQLGQNDIQPGLRYSTVFTGAISGNNTVTGTWADVPRGRRLNGGTLTLTATNQQIQVQSVTGDFGPVSWQRTPPAAPAPDIFDTFDKVKKNQNAIRDHSLLDNLKPAKSTPVSIFGTLKASNSEPAAILVAYRANDGRSYHDFICLDGNNSPKDGDMDFDLQVDRPSLDAQVGFWSNTGWEINQGVNPNNFRAKLNVGNHLHIESIMYGGTTECGDSGATSFLLPGWMQPGAIGALFNGTPIGGQVSLIKFDSGTSSLGTMLGRPVPLGRRVRITGILALDCGHGILHNCDEDVASTQNQEIHPMFSLDLVQDFRIQRPLAQLTGAWASNDGGTYYVTQAGDTVWWLGMSADAGRTFANVFHGRLDNQGRISGGWADIPLGGTTTSGAINLRSPAGQTSTAWQIVDQIGGFTGTTWEKLYDSGGNNVVNR